ncbi:N-acetylornithine deacetylase (EC [Olavius algarvensis Delta 1 endosymbiont]|nr:N-acetylornithine deacetylase (EC [Olavius algarvensis Delta 1 endosymbiont]
MKLNSNQKKEVLEFTQRLIGAPGHSGDEEKSALLVEKKMKQLGYDQVRIDPYGSVIGIIKGARPGPTILFDGHMDVVPIHEPDSWIYEPYGGEVVGDKLFGRGTTDMKGSIAAMIYAAAYLDKEKIAGTIMVTASTAEELIPGRAVEKILDEYLVDAVVIGEPTKLKLGFTEKGRCSISMTVTGKVAHSSSPQLGKNAIYIAADAIRRIKEIPVSSDPFLGDEFLELVEIRSEPTPGYGRVPFHCWGLWECRILPGENEQSMLDKFINSQKGSKWEDRIKFQMETIEVSTFTGNRLIGKDFLPAWREDKNSGLYKLLETAIQKSEIPVEYDSI